MTLVLAFREGDKNFLVADTFVTKLNSKQNKFEIVRASESKIKHWKNFALSMTTPNIAILDFFEHAIETVNLVDTKKAIYDMLVNLNKRISMEFTLIHDPKYMSYEWLLITQEHIWYFDSYLSITLVNFKAVGMFCQVADYILETNQGKILNKLADIYKYASSHATRVGKKYDIVSL